MSARLVGLLSVSALLVAGAVHAQDKKPPPAATVKPGVTLKPQAQRQLRRQLKPQLRPDLLQCAGPDPAVTALEVRSGNLFDDGSWSFYADATVRNRGRATFEPSGQAALQFYRGRRLIRSFDMGIGIAPDAEQRTTVRVEDWVTGGEFAEPLSVRIVYGPDAFIDGNEANDDCNMRNNRRDLDPDEVSGMLARG